MTKEQKHQRDKVYELLVSPCEKTRNFGIQMAETMNVDCSSFISSYLAFKSFSENKLYDSVIREDNSEIENGLFRVKINPSQKTQLEVISLAMEHSESFEIKRPYLSWKNQIDLALKYIPNIKYVSSSTFEVYIFRESEEEKDLYHHLRDFEAYCNSLNLEIHSLPF